MGELIRLDLIRPTSARHLDHLARMLDLVAMRRFEA